MLWPYALGSRCDPTVTPPRRRPHRGARPARRVYSAAPRLRSGRHRGSPLAVLEIAPARCRRAWADDRLSVTTTRRAPPSRASRRAPPSVLADADETFGVDHVVARVVGDGVRRRGPTTRCRSPRSRAPARSGVRLRPPARLGRGTGGGVALAGAPGARCCARSSMAGRRHVVAGPGRSRRARAALRRGRSSGAVRPPRRLASAVSARGRAPARRRVQRGARRVDPGERVALTGRRFRLPLPTGSPRWWGRCGGASSAARSRRGCAVRWSRGWWPTTSSAPRMATDGHERAGLRRGHRGGGGR